MKKVINGRRYDTDAAKKIADYSYSNRSDFNYWEETLYMKRTGEFFLYGFGGPMTRYAESAGLNQWTGGSKIIPLTVEKAKEWAEKYMDADEYEEAFGVIEEGDKKTVSFSLPESVIETIRRRAAEQNIPMSEYITQLVTQ